MTTTTKTKMTIMEIGSALSHSRAKSREIFSRGFKLAR